MTNPTPPAPKGLSVESKELLDRILAEYDFSDSASMQLLEELCRCHDRLASARRRIRRDGLMIRGSKGQLRPHPLLAAESALRRDLLALVRALRITLPEV
jgi:phage terminase small subunit